jgi:hypothetical protein
VSEIGKAWRDDPPDRDAFDVRAKVAGGWVAGRGTLQGGKGAIAWADGETESTLPVGDWLPFWQWRPPEPDAETAPAPVKLPDSIRPWTQGQLDRSHAALVNAPPTAPKAEPDAAPRDRQLWEYAEVEPWRGEVTITVYRPGHDSHVNTAREHQSETIRALLEDGWEPCGVAGAGAAVGLLRAFRRKVNS